MKSLTGLCVSSGKVEGTIQHYKPNKKYTKKDIVILNVWVTSGVVLLKNCGGIISSNGGLTCHASIIAREYGIPCLVGVKNVSKLKTGIKVQLDASNEMISII